LLVIAAIPIRPLVPVDAAFLNRILLAMMLGALAIAAIPFLRKVKGQVGSADSDDTVFKAYEDGKHRRYTLLFAVNGGAFAVMELLVKEGREVSSLTIPQVSYGMIIFTAIMCFDILAFGLKLRARSLADPDVASPWEGL